MERIKLGDSDAADDLNKWNDLGEEGLEILEGEEVVPAAEDVLPKPKKKRKINYLYNHYGVAPLKKNAKVVLNMKDQNEKMLTVDVFPDNKSEAPEHTENQRVLEHFAQLEAQKAEKEREKEKKRSKNRPQ